MKKMTGIMLLLGAALALAGCASTGTAVPAQEKPENRVSDSIAAIQIAYSLARYGYKNVSASALIGAAEILARTSTRPMEAEGEAQGDAEAGEEPAHQEFTPANLLADARKYAAGDATMLAWADKVVQGGERGPVGGPQQGINVVSGHGSKIFRLLFRAGEPATMFISGDGSTDLDLYIFDENGGLIGRDVSYSDDGIVRWTPLWTGFFTIEVRNLGHNWNRFVILAD